MNLLSLFGIVGLLAATAAARTCMAGDRLTGKFFASRSEVIARHGMAATSQPLATQVALDVLKAGGSAVDAAVAANATLGLMEPTGCGIGGDIFAIVWDAKTSQLYGLNGSGRSPQALSLDYFTSKGLKSIPPYGPLPITVPGCVDGWFELHKRFGRLPMDRILAPAIRYAEEGFPLSELIAFYWSKGGERLKAYPNFAATFFPGGTAPAKGDIFRNPDLATTYRILAEQGRDAFYRGSLAERMTSFCAREGCFLRLEDFKAHRSTWVDPVSCSYRGVEVWELPPNGQGIAALQMLNMLKRFDLSKMGHNSGPYLHHLIEAKKLAFEDRARFYADMDFADVPLQGLLSAEYAAQRGALINSHRANKLVTAGDPRLKRGDTIFLTVADKDRNMVSLIQSNYRGFGSGLVPDGMGFVFQDRGELFSLEPGHPNVFEPGKRPFHTIIPAFMTRNGKPWISFGVMGGDMQPQGHAQIVCNLIDFRMNLQEAGDAARFRHAGSSSPTGEMMQNGGSVFLESGVTAEARRALIDMGHDVRNARGGFGGYQAIMYDQQRDVYIGASESRKDGQAAGY
ncbi:MAG: gamma-glutamyltransferase [Planctomycetota bacterium]|jgi:gamma-glutamyltranspeptidase/glutathione hydrolase